MDDDYEFRRRMWETESKEEEEYWEKIFLEAEIYDRIHSGAKVIPMSLNQMCAKLKQMGYTVVPRHLTQKERNFESLMNTLMMFSELYNIPPYDIYLRLREMFSTENMLKVIKSKTYTDKVKKGEIKPAKKPGLTIEKVMELRNQGLSIQETADKMGCSVSTVKRYIREAKGNQDVTD